MDLMSEKGDYMLEELAMGELADMTVSAAGSILRKIKSSKDWKALFVDTGQFLIEYEEEAERIIDELSEALSPAQMNKFAEAMKSEDGYELREKLVDYALNLLRRYNIPADYAQYCAVVIANTIIGEIGEIAPKKYERYFLGDWRKENKEYLDNLSAKIEIINNSIAEFRDRNIKVFSSDEKDLELKRKTSNPKIGIDFFEIDDDIFKTKFSDQLYEEKICVRGRNVEETIYCILNELWRIRDMRAVFVVQSEDDWNSLRQFPLNDSVLIPHFIADEIEPIPNNTNIFIYTHEIPAFSNNIIDLRPRTRETIISCLNRAGMERDAAYALVNETHGLYVAMRKKLFSGQLLKQPEWVSQLDNRIKKTCLLLGQWTECPGDVAIIENLSGLKYSEFVSKITQFTKGEDPLIHIINRRGCRYYYLTSVENTWEYLQVSTSDDIWSLFVQLFIEVINEHERIFTYNQKELIQARIAGEEYFWSHNIRKGMLNTLLIKAAYKDHEECQSQLDSIVDQIFVHVDNDEKWKYITEFFRELCEIAPRIVLKRLFKELECPTGLISLFEHQDQDLIMGRNHYINVLFGIDELLMQKEFANDALIWLFRIDDKNFDYKSNKPMDSLARVFCTWHNFTAFRDSSDKIRVAELCFRYDRNAWDIIFDNLPSRNNSIFSNSCAPKYRDYLQEKTTTHGELHRTAVGYMDILLEHTEGKSERWEKVIGYCEKVDDSIRNKIFKQFLYESKSMDDSEIIIVKNSLRKIIHRHRYFSSASWAMPEKKLLEYEILLGNINISCPEYEYGYLFVSRYDIPLLNPVPYEDDNSRDINEQKAETLLSDKISEFKCKGYSIELLASICADMESSSLGSSLASYWNEDIFDVKVFTILLKSQKSGNIAVDYYSGFYKQAAQLFDTVLSIATDNGASLDVITNLYRIEAWNSKKKPKISTANEEIKKRFWNSNYLKVGYDNNWAIMECKRYGTLDSFLEFLYFRYHNKQIEAKKLFDFLDGIEEMPRAENGRDLQYYIEELLKPLQLEYMNDEEKCIRIATLEMLFSQVMDWGKMKCFRHIINLDPTVYADLVSVIFKKDNTSSIEHTEEEKKYISNLYSLYHKVEFCPSEIDGEIRECDLEEWIEKFKVLLAENDQIGLLSMLLGRLFAFSPVGRDGHMPCEAVRSMIEKYSDDSLQREYSITIFNSRGVFTSSGGKGELQMAEKYKSNADYFTSLGCSRTAEIYYELARRYFVEAKHEREDAENGDL